VTTVLDVMAVRASGDPALALVELGEPPLRIEERRCEVLVVGGGTGGTAAALAAARAGRSVCLLEETDWIGGQLTAQGVSALDEPSLGLAPIVVGEIARTIRELASRGLTIVLVEQNAAMALELADRAYLLESGHVSLHGTAAELGRTDVVRKLYLGA